MLGEIVCNKAAELLANSHNVSGVEWKTKKRLPEGSPLIVKRMDKIKILTENPVQKVKQEQEQDYH